LQTFEFWTTLMYVVREH